MNGSGNDSDEIENTNKLGEEELRRKSRQLSNQGIHGIIGKIEEIEINLKMCIKMLYLFQCFCFNFQMKILKKISIVILIVLSGLGLL